MKSKLKNFKNKVLLSGALALGLIIVGSVQIDASSLDVLTELGTAGNTVGKSIVGLCVDLGGVMCSVSLAFGGLVMSGSSILGAKYRDTSKEGMIFGFIGLAAVYVASALV